MSISELLSSITPPPHLTRASHFTPIKSLSQGAFGSVILAKNTRDSQLYALKYLKSPSLPLPELSILPSLNHPNIMKLHGAFREDSSIVLVMHACNGGSLFSRLSRFGSPGEDESARIAYGLLKAIGYLRSNKIIHRDIKSENVMIDDGEVVLVDFGWAVKDEKGMRDTYCGTEVFLAPEVSKGEGYDNSVDLWGLGIVVRELLTGESGDSEEVNNLSSEAREIIAGLLTSKEQRWSFEQVMRSKFIEKGKKADEKKKMEAELELLRSENDRLSRGVVKMFLRREEVPQILEDLVKGFDPDRKFELVNKELAEGERVMTELLKRKCQKTVEVAEF